MDGGNSFDNAIGAWRKDQNPLFLELCSGCGVLSATVASFGFDTMPVDHKHNKHRVHIKTFNLDLSDEHGWKTLRYVVEQCNVIAVHIAPPCGTCSRAREICLSADWYGPQPLRNSQYPYGVPAMSSKDRIRVEQANSLYKYMAEFCIYLNDRGIPWTVENPTNSWLWELPCMAHLMAVAFFTTFQSCAYGGQRYKNTSFLTNHPIFLSLCRQCGDVEPHEHLAWGIDSATQQFSTALEAEYPKLLCREYALLLVELAQDKGITLDPFPQAAAKTRPEKQQSGRAVPPLIPEYEKVISMLLQDSPQLNEKNQLTQPLPNIPAGSKLLRAEAKGGSYKMYVFGVYHSVKKFVQISKSLWHPFDELRHLPDFLTMAIFNVLSLSKVETMRNRLTKIQTWRKWALELADQENELKSKLPQHVRNVMRGKRILLLKKLAYEVLDWPDKNLIDDLCSGFKLVGQAPATGVFRVQPRPGNISEEELMKQSKFLRPAIIGKTNRSAPGLHDAEL